MTTAGPIIDDLRDESDALDALVSPLTADGWARPTPAPGWTIAHQIAHLWWTDRVALTSITDEAAFGEMLTAAAADPLGFVDTATEELTAATPPDELLARWRETRAPAARGTARGGRRPQAAVVRAADERGLDGHRAADGDLGARPGRRRRSRCSRPGRPRG